MKQKVSWLLAAFAVVFAIHAGFSMWRIQHMQQLWVPVDMGTPVRLYLEQQLYFLSASYALAGAFAVYAWLRVRKRQQASTRGVWGGITLAGVLYFGGCWLMGCCGSPLLPVYLSLFGSSFLGFTKPLILLSTLVSAGVGYW